MAEKPPLGTPQLKARFRVMVGEEIALGPGKVELLMTLAETTSLSEAAERLGMSYTRAWNLVRMMNACFQKPLVSSTRGGPKGGGMKVSEEGLQVIALYQKIERTALESSAPSWEELKNLLRS